MGLHDGHRGRKKQQFLHHGADSFSDHELLELALYYAIPRCDTNVTAHRLIERFGSLQNVLLAPIEELTNVEGIGENAAIFLHLMPAISKRAQQSIPKERKLDSVEKCGTYFLRLLGGEHQEVLYQLCLDGKGKLLACYQLSQGDMDSAALSVKQAVSNALTCGAIAVVLGHNHPSGVALPSEEDRAATLRVRDALKTLDIRLLDHIIVADGDYVSMAQSRFLL